MLETFLWMVLKKEMIVALLGTEAIIYDSQQVNGTKGFQTQDFTRKKA